MSTMSGQRVRPSLIVVLNRFDVANARSFGIEAGCSFRSTLSEKIPALVQILLEQETQEVCLRSAEKYSLSI
jgi:hypothetical protein